MKVSQDSQLQHRGYSPFDDSATKRIRRMSLISENGQPDHDAVAVLSDVYAGLYFDDLCDFCQDMRDVLSVLKQFLLRVEHAQPKERFLQICLLYDAIYRPMPDPVWWISGNPELVEIFSARFAQRIKQMAENEFREVST